jgi:hypothetical protein
VGEGAKSSSRGGRRGSRGPRAVPVASGPVASGRAALITERPDRRVGPSAVSWRSALRAACATPTRTNPEQSRATPPRGALQCAFRTAEQSRPFGIDDVRLAQRPSPPPRARPRLPLAPGGPMLPRLGVGRCPPPPPPHPAATATAPRTGVAALSRSHGRGSAPRAPLSRSLAAPHRRRRGPSCPTPPPVAREAAPPAAQEPPAATASAPPDQPPASGWEDRRGGRERASQGDGRRHPLVKSPLPISLRAPAPLSQSHAAVTQSSQLATSRDAGRPVTPARAPVNPGLTRVSRPHPRV